MELIPRLEQIQDRYGYLPKQEIHNLSQEVGLSSAEVIGIASFYEFFTFEPDKSKKHIQKLYSCCSTDVMLRCNNKYSWTALAKAKSEPDLMLHIINDSGLLGRSGAGFPLSRKWKLSKDSASDIKYVICNADEGELGTGKDRVLLEQNPQSVIEGMAICAEIVGAEKGYIYLRGEYADLRKSIESEIKRAPLENFEIEIRMGNGAYVCGEETALIASIENQRGEPRLKPPYPGVIGLYGKPTIVNNVETFACVPFIINYGAENFRSYGTENYPGTKLYTVFGCVNKPGVYEKKAGITAGELLQIAGGATKPVKALLTGGGSGTLISADCMDMPMSPEGCKTYGASFGTGSLRFISEDENIIAVVLDLVEFFAKESCGMCIPCRVGLKQLCRLIKKIESKEAYSDEIEELEALALHIGSNARCAMGQAAVTPVLSMINNFPEVLK